MKRYLGPILILFLVGFAIYAPNLNNQLFWDDDDWIINNSFVHDFRHIKEIFAENILAGFGLNSNYYRPLLLVSFAFNWVLHSAEPLGYHLLSNFFHTGAAVLLFLILYQLFKNKLLAFLAAIWWLVHPLNVEAVAYISGRGDPMSVFFMLFALFLYMKRRIWWSAGLMIAAVLSRETAILFPAFLMLFLLSFEYKDRFWIALKKSFIAAIPFWAVSVVYFLLRLTVLNFQNTLNFYSDANIYTENLSYRLFTFGHALVEYFKLILAPFGLHMERDLPVATSLFQWPVWLGAIIVFSILYIVYRLYRKRHSDFRIWFFGWGWFFIGLGPVSGIIPINALMYEHWLYLPLIGIAVLFGYYLEKIFSIFKLKKRTTYYVLLTTLLIIYLTFLSVLTIKRNIEWGNPIGFYENILSYNPNTVRVINNLANLYSDQGNTERAAELYQQAIDGRNGKFFAQPYYNLGNIHRDRGDIERAVELYKQAVEVDPMFPFAYQNLAVIYAERGELGQAAEMLEVVKQLRPVEPLVYYNLALIYNAQGNKQLALDNVQKGLELAKNEDTIIALQELLRQLNSNF